MQYSPFHYFGILLVKYHPAFKIKTIKESEQLTTEQTFPFSMFTCLILINRLTLITLITVSILNFVSKSKGVEFLFGSVISTCVFLSSLNQVQVRGHTQQKALIPGCFILKFIAKNFWQFILKIFGLKLSYRYNNSGIDWSNFIFYRNFNI